MRRIALSLALAIPAFAQSPPKVVIPVPDRDFDLTEVVVPWKALKDAGYQVVFASENGPAGPVPACDPRLIDHPVLKFWRLTARPEYIALYRQLEQSEELRAPIRWSEIDPAASVHGGAIELPGPRDHPRLSAWAAELGAGSAVRPAEVLRLRSQEEWNRVATHRHYEAAGAIVHFLCHADGGRWRGDLVRVLSDAYAGRSTPLAEATGLSEAALEQLVVRYLQAPR